MKVINLTGFTVLVIPYQCFRTTYWSHLQWSRVLDFLILEDGTDRLSQNVSKKLPLYAA